MVTRFGPIGWRKNRTAVCTALLAMLLAGAIAAACSSGGSTSGATPSSSGRGTSGPSIPTATPRYAPTIRPAAFSNKITNRYFPLSVGTTYVYEGKKEGVPERVEMTVTGDTKTILGVRCVVIHDVVTLRGELHEDTYDWYAQDGAGNVWYFGEVSKEYSGGQVISTKGSWEAGVAGAQPGIIMEASPRVGDTYRQEFYEGEAEDMAKVMSVSEKIDVMGQSYSSVVQTEDFTSLDPGKLEHKSFAPGLGFVLGRMVKGGSEEIKLVSVTRQ